MTFEEFDAAYRALTGHDGACRWQHRLFSDLEAGRFASDIELATGLGKTSIIALWVLALARVIGSSPCPVPRRLAYIVDRRVVVDQASEFAEEIRTRLERAADNPSHALYPFASALRSAGCTLGVLETSTLRGQRAEDTGWRDDPARPAIIVGTVDMIGSRLLFSAYGRVGPWGRSLEAGLLGQDCLVILDEAHLCSPFAATLAAIEHHQNRIAPFAVIRMGATMAPVNDLLSRTPGLVSEREANADARKRREPFRLGQDEICEHKVSERLLAPKWIKLIEPDASPGEWLAGWAVEKATGESGAVIGIVLNTIAEARRCTKMLKDKLIDRKIPLEDVDLVTITGSMRGWDRDALTDSKQYARFRTGRDRSILTNRSAFLVATSCIEVGADIDCDHLGTEVCAADSLIQRLGRVNRLGLRKETGSVVMVVGRRDDTTPSGRVFSRLHELANGGPLAGSAGGLPGCLLSGNQTQRLLDIRVPPPALTPAVLDDLAMTSTYPKTDARVDVSRWLHGSVEETSIYIEVAWRAELDWIAEVEGAARLLHAFPIAPRETARCPLYEAVEVLAAARDRAVKDQSLGNRHVFFVRDGIPDGQPFQSLPREQGDLGRLLHNALIVLPTSAGGYDGRFVDASASDPVIDIAEEAQRASRAKRLRLWVKSGWISQARGKSISTRVFIDPETTEEELIAESSTRVKTLLGSTWRLVEGTGDGQAGILVATEDRRVVEEAEEDEASLGFREPVLLEKHLGDARNMAALLCDRLYVSEPVRTAVLEAAGGHDFGKDCPWWQRAVGRLGKPPVAKSGQARFNHAINGGYRHEIGSVANLQGTASVSGMENSVADLCLHLVAAHHGHGRPGFRAEAAGPVLTDRLWEVIEATPARFARMQTAYGWWGLAWLEALVKAADVLASRER
jgi:CRISPR-associated endonuclease/helicase Cas3